MVVAYYTVADEMAPVTSCDSCTSVASDATVVCRCLNVTEEDLRQASTDCPLMSLCEVARVTGAGSGCTACHRRLRKFIALQNAGS